MDNRTGCLVIGIVAVAAGCGIVDTANKDEQLRRLKVSASELRSELAAAERRLKATAEEARAVEKDAEELASQLRSAGISVSPRGPAISVNVASRILFEAGEASLNEQAKKKLASIAKALKERFPDRDIVVEGHTDSVPPKKKIEEFPTNWELSSARAVAVARFLVEEGGLKPELVSAAAFADTKPIASNATPEGRSENRRVEIVVLPPIETKKVSARIE